MMILLYPKSPELPCWGRGQLCILSCYLVLRGSSKRTQFYLLMFGHCSLLCSIKSVGNSCTFFPPKYIHPLKQVRHQPCHHNLEAAYHGSLVLALLKANLDPPIVDVVFTYSKHSNDFLLLSYMLLSKLQQPCSFNLHADHIIWSAGLGKSQAEIKITGRNINNLRYADDTTLMAESGEKLSAS